ncbi:MAG: hypothetical protein OXC62_02645 [Aestuariivita sp.]|nr:hypothetical protein [Aestuariivita sp.]
MADIERSKRFSHLKERDKSTFFVGRNLYIDDIKMACVDAVESLRQGEWITSETRLFHGAPGLSTRHTCIANFLLYTDGMQVGLRLFDS